MKYQILVLLSAASLLAGCFSDTSLSEASPTYRLLRGDIGTDDYADAVRTTNVQNQRRAAFEINKDETRVYNTRTQRIQYMPPNSGQVWNPETQRWEYTPEQS